MEHSVASFDNATRSSNAGLKPEVVGTTDQAVERPGITIDRITHPVFVFSYLANLVIVTANASMFMFADWVAWLATNGTTSKNFQGALSAKD